MNTKLNNDELKNVDGGSFVGDIINKSLDFADKTREESLKLADDVLDSVSGGLTEEEQQDAKEVAEEEERDRKELEGELGEL